ncbi:MAG: hypothetical protein NT154_44270 [Verrucomicrobia bacterium]|nr:hypothetical protein [Verrucomicrobiota bacterium]
MSRRFFSWFLLLLVGSVLLPPIFLSCYYRVALKRYKVSLRAAGHLKTLAEARPQPLPDLVNGGAALTNLMPRLPSLPAAIQPGGAKGLPAGTRRVDWAQPELPSEEQTNLWPDLRVFLGTIAADSAALRSALESPVLEFSVIYEDGLRMRLPHFAKIRVVLQLLCADAQLQLHDGKPELALADTIAGVHLAARWNREPILITQFMRIAAGKIMVNPTWELLQFQDWKDGDLAALQKAWMELDLPASVDAVLDLEAANMVELLGHLSRKEYAGFSLSGSGSAEAAPDTFIGILKLCCRDPKQGGDVAWDRYPRWWAFQLWRRYELEQVALQRIDRVRGAMRSAVAQGAWLAPLHELESYVTRMDASIDWAPEFIKSGMGPSYTNIMAKYVGIEAQRSLVLAAIALERHQHKHGSYPDSLKLLVPEFLASLPRDPMDGQTLRYRRKNDSTFTLYSVGRDGQDDGGNPTPVGTSSYWENGKDIVWPKPASQAEADADYKSITK